MPDLGATILNLANAKATYETDGQPIQLSKASQQSLGDHAAPRHTIAEYWNTAILEGIYADGGMCSRLASQNSVRRCPLSGRFFPQYDIPFCQSIRQRPEVGLWRLVHGGARVV